MIYRASERCHLCFLLGQPPLEIPLPGSIKHQTERQAHEQPTAHCSTGPMYQLVEPAWIYRCSVRQGFKTPFAQPGKGYHQQQLQGINEVNDRQNKGNVQTEEPAQSQTQDRNRPQNREQAGHKAKSQRSRPFAWR